MARPVAGASTILVLVFALLCSTAFARPGGPARAERDRCCWFPPDRRDCARAEAHSLVLRFVRAFNAGRTRALDRIFAKEPAFHWYSTGKPGERSGAAAENRSTLMRYFALRHRHRERLELLSWTGGQTPNAQFDFSFVVRRRADRLRPRALEGKGALYCARRGNKIIVWSNGAAVRSSTAWNPV